MADVIKYGEISEDVQLMQSQLWEYLENNGKLDAMRANASPTQQKYLQNREAFIDGRFGGTTQWVLKEVQKELDGLRVDGIYGPNTTRELHEAISPDPLEPITIKPQISQPIHKAPAAEQAPYKAPISTEKPSLETDIQSQQFRNHGMNFKVDFISMNEQTKPSTKQIADAVFKGMIKTESGGRQFDQNGNPLRSMSGDTDSPVGAGQIRPSTAQGACRAANISFDANRLASDKSYNLRVSRAEYDRLCNYYDDPYLAAMAYNTGSGNLNRYISEVGDPRKDELSMQEFIDQRSSSHGSSRGSTQNKNYLPTAAHYAGIAIHELYREPQKHEIQIASATPTIEPETVHASRFTATLAPLPAAILMQVDSIRQRSQNNELGMDEQALTIPTNSNDKTRTR